MTAAASTNRLLRLFHKGLSRTEISRASGTVVCYVVTASRSGSTSRQSITAGVGAMTFLWTALCFAKMARDDETIKDENESKRRESDSSKTSLQGIWIGNYRSPSPFFQSTSTRWTRCESGPIHFTATTDQEFDDESGYMEAERFYQCLNYHRSLLKDYNRRWGPKRQQQQQLLSNSNSNRAESRNTAVQWPRNTPLMHEVSALECDLRYCERSTQQSCQDAKFRIASFYVSQTTNESQLCGFHMLKDLAEENHADGMCYYGILLSRGLECANVGADPQRAVTWWLKCVDDHRHIQATYELATACYLGEGLPENSERAVYLFSRAANLGHAGAAYILGECLLYGAGVERDRANALEWLVTAAELGHRGARDRVLMVLTDEATTTLHNDNSSSSSNCNSSNGTLSSAQEAAAQCKQEEDWKWQSLPDDNEVKLKAVNIERRYTIGDSPRNITSLEVRRKTIVSASRGED